MLKKLEKIGRFLEDATLVVMLCVLIGLAATQILLRNVLDTGFVWADELLRLLVLWLALMGAVAASRDDRHIRIDVLSRFLSRRLKLAVRILLDAITAAICCIIAWHAAGFVMEAREFEDVLLGGLPAWPFQSVLPIAFAWMGYRYIVFFFRHTYSAFIGLEQ